MRLNDIGDLLGNAIDEDLDYYLYETPDGNVVVQVRFDVPIPKEDLYQGPTTIVDNFMKKLRKRMNVEKFEIERF